MLAAGPNSCVWRMPRSRSREPRAASREPRAGESLIRHAAGSTPTESDWSETCVDRQGHDRTPTIPSHAVSGVVEELGAGVTQVVAGEEVYGLVPFDQDGAAAD